MLDRNGAELFAGGDRLGEEAFDLFREGIRSQVPIYGNFAPDQIADSAADEIYLMVGSADDMRNLFQPTGNCLKVKGLGNTESCRSRHYSGHFHPPWLRL